MTRWTSDCIAARQLEDDFHEGIIDVDEEKVDAKLVWESRDCYKLFSKTIFRGHYNKAWAKHNLESGNTESGNTNHGKKSKEGK